MNHNRAEIEQAHAHLAEAEARIRQQRMEIEGRRAAGMSTAASEVILASMVDAAETLRRRLNSMHRSSDRT